MKSILPYILVVVAAFILSGAVVVGTLMFKPELLRGGKPSVAAQDSTAVNKGAALHELAGPTPAQLKAAVAQQVPGVKSVPTDSAATPPPVAQAQAKPADTAAVVAKPVSEATPAPPPTVAQAAIPTAGADSLKMKEQKAKAKVLEAMPPENAAKILANLSDDESRELLKYVKTRQAAKILAAIQPERASRLLR